MCVSQVNVSWRELPIHVDSFSDIFNKFKVSLSIFSIPYQFSEIWLHSSLKLFNDEICEIFLHRLREIPNSTRFNSNKLNAWDESLIMQKSQVRRSSVVVWLETYTKVVVIRRNFDFLFIQLSFNVQI